MEAAATEAAAGAARCNRRAAEGLGEVLSLPASCADDQRHGVGSQFWQIPAEVGHFSGWLSVPDGTCRAAQFSASCRAGEAYRVLRTNHPWPPSPRKEKNRVLCLLSRLCAPVGPLFQNALNTFRGDLKLASPVVFLPLQSGTDCVRGRL